MIIVIVVSVVVAIITIAPIILLLPILHHCSALFHDFLVNHLFGSVALFFFTLHGIK